LPFLLHVLAFLGTTDVEVIDVEGTAFGPQAAGRQSRRRWPRSERSRSGGVRPDATRRILMLECFSEPTLTEVLSDPLVLDVMASDGVDPSELEAAFSRDRHDIRRRAPKRKYRKA
jgi:hypothetical protein